VKRIQAFLHENMQAFKKQTTIAMIQRICAPAAAAARALHR
jgi:hypothetical protein